MLSEYEAGLAAARAQAHEMIRQTAERAAAEAAERQHQVAEALSEQIKAAERQISMAKEQAFSEIRGVAIDVARSLTEKLIGAEADRAERSRRGRSRGCGEGRLMPRLFADPEFWVLVAVIVLIAALWKPAKRILIGSLDDRATRIREELDAARNLREEAERLLASYRLRQGEGAGEARSDHRPCHDRGRALCRTVGPRSGRDAAAAPTPR